jgi:hypothetical protein
MTREERRSVLNKTPTLHNFVVFLTTVSYVFYYFIALTITYCLITIMYQTRNPWVAGIVLALEAGSLLAMLDDLAHIGSPWGIQELSEAASNLASSRIYTAPVTLVLAVCLVVASFPPSDCVEC